MNQRLDQDHRIAEHAPAAAPEQICANCLAAWRAAKPQPAAVYCHHRHAIAWPTANGWRIDRPSDASLKRLREQGYV